MRIVDCWIKVEDLHKIPFDVYDKLVRCELTRLYSEEHVLFSKISKLKGDKIKLLGKVEIHSINSC